MVKVRAHFSRNLTFGHFVHRFKPVDAQGKFVSLDALLELPFCLSGAKEKKGARRAQAGNDLIVIDRQMPCGFPFAGIISWNYFCLKRSCGRGKAAMARRLFHTGFYTLRYLPLA